MNSVVPSLRPFVPGTTGWTAEDLDDPAIERQWFEGRYEIVDGVLTTMPPAYFDGQGSLEELMFMLKTHLKMLEQSNRFASEFDIVNDEYRVDRAEAVSITTDDFERQREAMARAGKSDPKRTRVLIPPTLVIESVSLGHERHDERTKRKWYAEFGIPNYWILNTFSRSLRCLIREGAAYRLDVEGRQSDEMRPALFPGLTILLAQLWLE